MFAKTWKSALLLALPLFSFCPSAFAWGCKGHQVVALIAEARLSPRARAAAEKILAGAPIDPALKRYCDPTGLDPFADSATWADDYRTQHPETGGWHFLDIPRGAPKRNLPQYCPPSEGCVTAALTAQMAVLRDKNATPQQRGDALRFVLHFAGDIHQALHDTTNNDRGGNCIPVGFYDKAPMETDSKNESYSPNLHSVWDTSIIERFAANETSAKLAEDLSQKFALKIPAWQAQHPDFYNWAWEAHQLADRVTYGKLPHKIAVEKPVAIMSCADDNHISTRMLQLNETLGDSYENAAVPAIEQQLAKAGARLASLLNSLWR